MHVRGQETPYCQRLGNNRELNRKSNFCENQGEKHSFRDLVGQNIKPKEILGWHSSIEKVDMYAAVFYNRSLITDDDEQFVCKCIQSGTFGKYCEYKLMHEKTFFSATINAQFEQKRSGDSWNTQRYGNILCYLTLEIDFNTLCLDWRDICDGYQRRFGGVDEENCDKLEFNECENDEFRCTNGMCISEEFWLDGNYDCMDWSDELPNINKLSCSFDPNAIECDEHTCFKNYYSCGDGECVQWVTRMAFLQPQVANVNCFNKRNLNFICEASPRKRAWTLTTGLCWPDEDYDDPRYPPWYMVSSSNLTKEEKCQYLFRCMLSNGFEHDCPCNARNCTRLMMSVCGLTDYVLYPPTGVLNSNLNLYYNYSRHTQYPQCEFYTISGCMKCLGYNVCSGANYIRPYTSWLLYTPQANNVLCWIQSANGNKQFSIVPHGRFCWNGSFTFNGRPYAVDPDVCKALGECISQYRIRDGSLDCGTTNDEHTNVEKDYCTGNVGRHRFQCFNNERRCLNLFSWLTVKSPCSNFSDYMLHDDVIPINPNICLKGHTSGCDRLKEYIGRSSTKNSSNIILFDSPQQRATAKKIQYSKYCNSFWNLDKHLDEISSYCQHWV
ncbi:unnamed protein product, partial [Rotaria magnacalcarata]